MLQQRLDNLFSSKVTFVSFDLDLQIHSTGPKSHHFSHLTSGIHLHFFSLDDLSFTMWTRGKVLTFIIEAHFFFFHLLLFLSHLQFSSFT